MIAERPFIGEEAEGVDIGKETVFIPKGSTRIVGVDKLYNDIVRTKLQRFYFGAGNRPGAVQDDVSLMQRLHKRYPNCQILLECTIPDLRRLPPIEKELRVEIILVAYTMDFKTIPNLQHVKFVSKEGLVWFHIDKAIQTSLKDKLYNTDKAL